MSKKTNDIVDLNLVKIIENELLDEFKTAHDAYYNYKDGDDSVSDKLLDQLSLVEEKIKEKLQAFESLIESLLSSYQKSLNQYYDIEASNYSSYRGTALLVSYKFDLMADILISITDDIGLM